MSRRRAAALGAAALAVAALLVWRGPWFGEEREIRGALASLAADFNATAGEGLGTLARAAQLGGYFTGQVVVDLGPGSALIEGRERLVGMAARLQPRTAAYRVVLDDIAIDTAGAEGTADVVLTVSFVERNTATDEETTDPREFALQMIKDGGRWRIARATAIDAFRK